MLEGTSIFNLPGKVPLWQKCQNYVFCGNMNADVSPYVLKFKFFFKILVPQWLLGFVLVYCSQKVKWHTFPKMFAWLYFIETKHTFYIWPAVRSISNKGIIMKILKYAYPYTICMLIYFSLKQKPFQLRLNVLPHITKH